ncbi:HNH endonuclease signature motif containing protein [Demequina aurantiaca]|uniref:HNH endonuclease signature motif containing protein n=1 Tax=Demequina aurantiaca TaxID=676200 RepID=UPI00078456D0|nr:HNH endonuclease signature motif containing protein [Demequina aurantiaca]
MTILTSSLAREVGLLRAFEGRTEAELSKTELDELREAVGGARRALDVIAATMAGEVERRSAPDLGVGGLARKEGFSNSQQFLATTLGTSAGDAGRLIAMGQALRAEVADDVLGARDGGVDGESGVSGTVEPVRAAAQPRYPHLAAAITAGRLGSEQSALIKRTLDACRTAMTDDAQRDDQREVARAAAMKRLEELEQRLVAKAPTLRLADLRRVCDRERAWCSPLALAAKERRHVENRSLFFGEDPDGMTTMTARMDAASAAPIKAWIDAQTKWAFQQRREMADGGAGLTDPRMPGQIRLDALASLARHGMDCDQPTSGVKTTVVVRIDERDLRERVRGAGSGSVGGTLGTGGGSGGSGSGANANASGSGSGSGGSASGDNIDSSDRSDRSVAVDSSDPASPVLGECDQLNGPVTVGTLRSLAVDAAIIPVMLGGESLPLDIGRRHRTFTSAQRIGLVERDGGCSWCHAPPSFCEAHHIRWWARDNGPTDLSNGVMLCTGCHHRIHRDNWTIEVKRGEVWFTPPPGVSSETGPRLGGKAHLALGGSSDLAA